MKSVKETLAQQTSRIHECVMAVSNAVEQDAVYDAFEETIMAASELEEAAAWLRESASKESNRLEEEEDEE